LDNVCQKKKIEIGQSKIIIEIGQSRIITAYITAVTAVNLIAKNNAYA
jgi:molybdopterin-binding protein